MVATKSNLRGTKRGKMDLTITLNLIGIKKVLNNIDTFNTNISNVVKLPLAKMMRAKINKLNANLQKIESIGTDLSNRLKHTRAMGSFSGRDRLILDLESEVDLFYEMMTKQSKKYIQTVR